MLGQDTDVKYFEDEKMNNIINEIIKIQDKISIYDMMKSKNFMYRVGKSDTIMQYLFSLPEIQQYIQNLNNLKVNPIMTSFTEPSGRITYSSYYYSALNAFDSSTSNGWTPSAGENAKNSYIQYQFNENDFMPFKIKIIWGSEGTNPIWNFKYKIQASKDNVNFEDITEETTVTGATTDLLDCLKKDTYKYFKVVFLTDNYNLHVGGAYSIWLKDFRIYGI